MKDCKIVGPRVCRGGERILTQKRLTKQKKEGGDASGIRRRQKVGSRFGSKGKKRGQASAFTGVCVDESYDIRGGDLTRAAMEKKGRNICTDAGHRGQKKGLRRLPYTERREYQMYRGGKNFSGAVSTVGGETTIIEKGREKRRTKKEGGINRGLPPITENRRRGKKRGNTHRGLLGY